MDPRFTAVVADDDPRFRGVMVATLADRRQMGSLPIGAIVAHAAQSMTVIGRDANRGVVRLQPAPSVPVIAADLAAAGGVVHLNEYEDREESQVFCTGQAAYPSSGEVESATCPACLAAAEVDALASLAAIRARLAAIGGTP